MPSHCYQILIPRNGAVFQRAADVLSRLSVDDRIPHSPEPNVWDEGLPQADPIPGWRHASNCPETGFRCPFWYSGIKTNPTANVVQKAVRTARSQIVQRAFDYPLHRPRQLRVNFCGPHITVSQKLLNRTEVHPAKKQMGREAVAQRVGGDPLLDPGRFRCAFQLPRNANLVEMMAPEHAAPGIGGTCWGRKEPEPRPGHGSRRVLAFQGSREINSREPGLAVFLMDQFDPLAVGLQIGAQLSWQRQDTVLVTISTLGIREKPTHSVGYNAVEKKPHPVYDFVVRKKNGSQVFQRS